MKNFLSFIALSVVVMILQFGQQFAATPFTETLSLCVEAGGTGETIDSTAVSSCFESEMGQLLIVTLMAVVFVIASFLATAGVVRGALYVTLGRRIGFADTFTRPLLRSVRAHHTAHYGYIYSGIILVRASRNLRYFALPVCTFFRFGSWALAISRIEIKRGLSPSSLAARHLGATFQRGFIFNFRSILGDPHASIFAISRVGDRLCVPEPARRNG